MTTNPLAFIPAQRGRASVDFMIHLARGSQPLRGEVAREQAEMVPDPSVLPEDLDLRDRHLGQSCAASPAFRASQLLGEFHARMHGLVAREAFEEVREDLEPVIARYQEQGPTTLEPAPEGAETPAYFEGVHFHRTAGGWEEHEMQGYIHGEIVHRKLVEALYPGGIFQQRRAVAAMAPRRAYERILDMGASTGHFTQALQETYPEAEITGVDLSLRVLEHAQRIGNAQGYAWKLYQRPAEDTGFAEASFDLVASYILLHEIPADVIRRVFAEAYRVLEPGGDMIMSDVTRYADMDKLAVWRADSGARLGGEPYWRESASLDLAEVAREAGFVDVTAQGIYPHVVIGRKPG
ncbi:class I SAM-dependent methyltransferase [Novosphingobium profundi]|uniref:class I SAM-dependent methyltransferase n=1 Tax=Novosphingobium profundi TaxID=1774954 RepID=UPI001BD99EFD|nr:class I SAM-dependent methyltransferase [Novosphingobium profundi]MBT0668214.1 class I SAM-dependent methyltransferase [Novosphingobium profundi]